MLRRRLAEAIELEEKMEKEEREIRRRGLSETEKHVEALELRAISVLMLAVRDSLPLYKRVFFSRYTATEDEREEKPKWQRRLAAAVLCAYLLFCLLWLTLFSLRSDRTVQSAWLIAFAIAQVKDFFLVLPIKILLSRGVLPTLIRRDVRLSVIRRNLPYISTANMFVRHCRRLSELCPDAASYIARHKTKEPGSKTRKAGPVNQVTSGSLRARASPNVEAKEGGPSLGQAPRAPPAATLGPSAPSQGQTGPPREQATPSFFGLFGPSQVGAAAAQPRSEPDAGALREGAARFGPLSPSQALAVPAAEGGKPEDFQRADSLDTRDDVGDAERILQRLGCLVVTLTKVFAILFAVMMILPEDIRDLFFDVSLPVAIALFMLVPMPFADALDQYAALALDFAILIVFMSALMLLVAYIDGRTEKAVHKVERHRGKVVRSSMPP